MTNELIEAMAIAAYESEWGPWFDAEDEDKDEARERVRAALSAAESAGYRLVPKLSLAAIWAHGYDKGHSDGIGCGHPLARMCAHFGDDEAGEFADEINELAAAPDHVAEVGNMVKEVGRE